MPSVNPGSSAYDGRELLAIRDLLGDIWSVGECNGAYMGSPVTRSIAVRR